MGWFWNHNDYDEKLDKIIELVYTVLDYAEVIDEKVNKLMAAQDDVNAAVAAVNSLLSDMQTQVGNIATDVTAIQQLIAAGQPVNTDALNAAVANIANVQASLDQGVAALTAVS